MREQTEAQDKCYALVSSYLRQAFGELAEPWDGHPGYRLGLGRLPVYVLVYPWGDDAYVVVYAYPGRGVEVTGEVASRLLELNAEHGIGANSLDSDGDIALSTPCPAML